MPQDFFEPRTPVNRPRPPRLSAGPGDSPHTTAERPATPAPPPSPAPRAEPSWPRIYWNTLRSFLRRRLGLKPRALYGDDGGAHDDGTRRTTRRRPVLVGAAVLVAVAVAVTAVLLNRPWDEATDSTAAKSVGTKGGSSAGTPSRVSRSVARWVTAHVGAGQVVACDTAVCGVLTDNGLPATSTVPVRRGVQDVQNADVVVLTPTLRARLGAKVDEVTAAQPLAAFGTGTDTATVVAVAHAGQAAYAQALATDREARYSAGAQLLTNKRVVLTSEAREALEAGEVDMRACALLATLSGVHTVTVASFGPPTPGAGADIPRATVEISAVDGRPATADNGPARSLRRLIDAQQAPYQPLKTASEDAKTASSGVLSLLYSQPTPLVADPTDPSPATVT